MNDTFHDLTAYLLGELSPDEHAAVTRALAADPALQAELESIRAMHEALRGHLAAEAGPEPLVATTIPFRAPISFPRRTLRFAGSPAGFTALCACVALVAGVAIFSRDKGVVSQYAKVDAHAAIASPLASAEGISLSSGSGSGASAVDRVVTPAEKLPNIVGAGKSVLPSPGKDLPEGAGSNAPRSEVLNLRSDGLRGGLVLSGENTYVGQTSAASGSGFGAAAAASVRMSKGGGGDESYLVPHRALSSGDRHDAGVTEQAFVNAAEHPLATFSIDVNTASYAYARRMITAGRRPAPESVRIEEWLNNFDHPYPQPSDGSPISLTVDGAECPWNTAHRIVRVGLRARTVAPGARPPCNLVFLIDTSGSMNPPDRLPLAQESLLKMLGKLDERDHVAIITYAGSSTVAAEPTVCDAAGKKKLEKAILALSSRGSTNGADGLRDAYRYAAMNAKPGVVSRVVLATDGDFNVGVSDTEGIVEIAKREAAKKTFLTVLGFGTDNLNGDLMKQLSVKADGNHYYIDSLAEADRVLGAKLTGTLVPVARDVKIQIDFNPANVASYRLLGYDTRRLANEDFNDDTKDAGEMGSGHTVTALYEIIPVGAPASVDASRYAKESAPVPATSPRPFSDEWLTLKVRWQPVEGGPSTLIEKPLKAAGITPLSEASPDLVFTAAVAEAALNLRESKFKGSADISSALELLARPGVVGENAERKEFADLLRRARHAR